MRRMGLDVIGEVPWGTHFCQFYQTEQDLADVLVPYFQQGLESNEFCMWITSTPLNAAAAATALRRAVPDLDERIRRGQIEILSYDQWYTLGGHFDADRVLKGWVKKEEDAIRRGYEGLRLTGNTCWLEKADWKSFSDYEAAINRVIGDHRIIALCTYAIERCNAVEIIDVVNTHQFALIKRSGTWEIIQSEQHKRVQAALRQGAASTYNRSLIEASLDPLVTIDAQGKITDVNAATEKVTGRTRKELIGTDFSDYFTEPSRARAGYQQVFREGSVQDYALEIRHRDGHRTPVLYNASVYCDEAGKVLGVFAAARDVTERRRVEEELRRLNEQLELRVAARTAELAASNRELEAFAYSVSHDLRAPLRAIDGFSQALLEDYADKVDPEGRGHLQRVRIASQRMGQLIDGLLSLSRTTRTEMRRTTVNMSILAAGICQELQKTAPDRQIEFVTAPNLLVNADASLLRILLENLLGNAFKFTGKHPTARIEVGSQQDNGQTVYFVRDDGAGFDMTYASNLFSAFRRLHAMTEFEGTGIGLATVQRIVHRHGGKVWAEGQIEKGATIYFTIPTES